MIIGGNAEEDLKRKINCDDVYALLRKVYVKRKQRSKVIKFDCLLRRLKISKEDVKRAARCVICVAFTKHFSKIKTDTPQENK